MKNIEKAFANHAHIDKIRIAKFVTQTVTSSNPEITARNGMMNTVLGLLAKGDMNCAGGEATEADLFSTSNKQPVATAERTKARQAAEIPTGVVRTEAEKQQAEEEARRKREEEERLKQEEAAEEERKRRRKEKSLFYKCVNGLKRLGETMTKEETDN